MSRSDRVAELIKKEISDILRKEVSDPRIGFVSITEVEIGADLGLAKIFVSVMGSEKEKKDAMKGLISATKHIRFKLGPRLGLKSVPEIIFKADSSFERGNRVLQIISQISKEKK